MAKCKVLAFLLCENATRALDEKVTLHGLFDRIIIPRTSREDKLFFVYYKIVVEGVCAVSLRVTHSSGQEISGSWCHKHSHVGPIQAVWFLTASLFKQSGRYELELREESTDAEPVSLATTQLVVDQQEE
jgi:hypothetical protein